MKNYVKMSKLVKLSDYTCGSRLAVMRLVIAFKCEKNAHLKLKKISNFFFAQLLCPFLTVLFLYIFTT